MLNALVKNMRKRETKNFKIERSDNKVYVELYDYYGYQTEDEYVLRNDEACDFELLDLLPESIYKNGKSQKGCYKITVEFYPNAD